MQPLISQAKLEKREGERSDNLQAKKSQAEVKTVEDSFDLMQNLHASVIFNAFLHLTGMCFFFTIFVCGFDRFAIND